MALIDYIKAKVSAEVLATRDPVVIAAATPARVELVKTIIGAGTIISVMGVGPSGGGELLSKLRAGRLPAELAPFAADISEILPVIDRGDLDMGAVATRSFVGLLQSSGLVSSDQATALLALGENPVAVTEFDVRCALWDEVGNWLGGA